MNNFSDFASNTGRLFDRVKQFTQETFDPEDTPKTEYIELKEKINKSEKVKVSTEEILEATEHFLDPRATNFNSTSGVLTAIKGENFKSKYHQLSVAFNNGSKLEAPPDTQKAFQALADAYNEIGNDYLHFSRTATSLVVHPLNNNLEVCIKPALASAKKLNTLRLDLDAAKAKDRRADTEGDIMNARKQLRNSQYDFDHQLEETEEYQDMVLKLPTSQALLLRHLIEQHRSHLLFATERLEILLKEQFPEIEGDKSPALSALSDEDEPLSFDFTPSAEAIN